MPKTYAVPPPPHHNEGKTVAAWTMNLGIVLGALAIGIAMVVGARATHTRGGAAVLAVSRVDGAVLPLAGLRQPRGYGEKQAAQTAVDSSDRNARSERPAEADAR